MSHERCLAAAQRILGGDNSIRAANELECVVLDHYPGDERFDELAEVLALYAPGQGTPYSEATKVRAVIRKTIVTVRVMSHERFLAAAQRILGGDNSIRAANELECVVLDHYPGDERFDELAEVLALYAPGQGTPYSEATKVRAVIRKTIASIG